MLSKALTYPYIWTSEFSDAELSAAKANAKDDLEKEYLEVLRKYCLKLTENNQRYNAKEAAEDLSSQLTALSTTIPKEPEFNELRAAVLNLLGLIAHKMQKDLEAADKYFTAALRAGYTEEEFARFSANTTQIGSLSRACILSNTSILHLDLSSPDVTKLISSVAELIDDVAEQNVQEDNVEVNRLIGTVCANVAIVMCKLDSREAIAMFNRAMILWPENNFIANNAAINLSKLALSNDKALLDSEAILARFYDNAVATKKFVTPYYRANVNIKLARYAKTLGEKAALLERANECLGKAEEALDPHKGNENYSSTYRQMSTARLSFQLCLKAGVEGDKEAAIRYRELAISQRDAVPFSEVETQAKKDKFKEKMNFVIEPEFTGGVMLNIHSMFRPHAASIPAATVQDASRVTASIRP